MITQDILEALPAHSLFAAGVVHDVTDGINLTADPKRIFKWVAVRGGIPDWAVYVGDIDDDLGRIADCGDKLLSFSAFNLLACDEAAQKMYRS